MCRLFGFRSAVPSRAHKSLVEAHDALVRQSAAHPHGWGLGWIDAEDAYVVKTARAALDCGRFRSVSEGLRSHTFIGHLRKATVGGLDHLNAHPFRHGRWLFAHNGSIWGMDAGMSDWLAARTDARLAMHVLGDTDSERLFVYLLTAISHAGGDPTGRRSADAKAVGEAVRAALLEIDTEAVRRGLDRPLLNVLLTDGRMMISHRAGFSLFLSTQKHACPDALTCPAVKVCLEATRPPDAPVNHLLIASEPLATAENRWEPIVDGSTVILTEAFELQVLPPEPGWVAPELPADFPRLRMVEG